MTTEEMQLVDKSFIAYCKMAIAFMFFMSPLYFIYACNQTAAQTAAEIQTAGAGLSVAEQIAKGACELAPLVDPSAEVIAVACPLLDKEHEAGADAGPARKQYFLIRKSDLQKLKGD